MSLAATSELHREPWDKRPGHSVREAAHLLGLSERSMYRAVERGEVKAVRIGDKLVIPTDEIRKLLKEAR